jgi:thiamine pyrophosphate-dependent acetolactate synthase large subunit-like protein
VNAKGVTGREELAEALKKAYSSKKPELIEVPVTPGMALF